MAESETEITREQLQKEISEILDKSSLENTSTKKVIQKLESKLGVDLTAKKKLIDQLVMEYVNDLDSEEEEMPRPKQIKKEQEDEDDEDIHDDSNDSDWGSGKKKKVEEKKKKAAPKSKKEKTKKGGAAGGVTKKKGGGKGSGYTKACKLSPELAELMGESELPRHEVVKRVWAIIKEKQLFDPKNRQFCICDKALFKVIGEESFRTFSMMKYLKNHFLD